MPAFLGATHERCAARAWIENDACVSLQEPQAAFKPVFHYIFCDVLFAEQRASLRPQQDASAHRPRLVAHRAGHGFCLIEHAQDISARNLRDIRVATAAAAPQHGLL